MTEPESDHQQEHRSLVSETLASLTAFSVRHPRWIVALMIVSALGCTWCTASFLKFKTNRADLIDPSAAFQQRWLKFTESFGHQDDMIIVVESSSPERIKQVQEAIGSRLKQQPKLFANVLYRIEPGTLREKGLQYLAPQQLAVGLDRLKDYQPVLDGKWDTVRLERVVNGLRNELLRVEQQRPNAKPAVLEHIDRLSTSLASFVDDKNGFTNPWPDVIPLDQQMTDQKDEVVYVLNDEGTLGFVMASPVASETDDKFQGETSAVDVARQIIREVGGEYDDAKISMTGIPVLENDEMRRSQNDMAWASILSFIGVAILQAIGLRGFRHAALGMTMLAVAMTWAFGYTTFAIGHLNILSVAFAAILIGLGDDYSVHTISRYLELRHAGKPLRAALIEGAGTTGVGILTGSITTALAFFSATLTDFLGVAELGLIAGGGILLCALASFTILPAMVCLADRYTEPHKLPSPFQGTLLRKISSEKPWFVLGFSLAVFAIVGCWACDWTGGRPKLKIAYDHNLLNLQAKGLESVETQRRIFEASQHSLLYAISLADSAEEAREMKSKLESLPSVHRVEELATRLPEHPPTETKLLVQGYHALLAHLPAEPEPPGQADHLAIGKALENLYLQVHERRERLGDKADAATIHSGQQLDHFLDEFSSLSYFVQLRFLGEFEYRMSYALLAQLQALEAASNPVPVSLADLPSELRTRFVSPDGKWLLQIFPKDQIWDMEPLERFVTEVRTVDPEVTGTPLQNFEATRQIKTSYEICAVYALLVILLVLQIDFMDKRHVPLMLLPPLAVVLGVAAMLQASGVQGYLVWLVAGYTGGSFVIAFFLDRSSVYDSLLALTPPGIGLMLALGLLGAFGIPLNPANLIILPLILGIGVDHGVHVIHDYHSKPNQVYSISPSTLTAILLCAATTMVGFGSMMIAAHRGLYSLGAVLTTGVASCTFIALIPLPAVLALISRHQLAAVPKLKLAEETVTAARVA